MLFSVLEIRHIENCSKMAFICWNNNYVSGCRDDVRDFVFHYIFGCGGLALCRARQRLVWFLQLFYLGDGLPTFLYVH